MLGIITFCVVVITIYETIKFVNGIIEAERSKEMFDEFMKNYPTPKSDDKDELPFE
jgi:hypothetical protein